MDEQPKILITRLSHIGDCVLTLPMVNRIKDRYPDSTITWAIESPTQKLLAGHRAVDEFLVVPKRWMKQPSCWVDLRRQFRQRNFDIAIDPQGITKSAMLGWLSGAKTRIGVKGKWGRELSPWLNNRLVEPRESHLADRSLELLSQIEGEPVGLRSVGTISDLAKSDRRCFAVKEFAQSSHGRGLKKKAWQLRSPVLTPMHL